MLDESPALPPPISSAAVETFGLTRHYGNLTALNQLDLTDAQKQAIVDEGNLVFALNIGVFEELEGNPVKALWSLASSSLAKALGLGNSVVERSF